ncbi:MAG: ParA family protein [Caldilineaceae bacterium]
MKTIAICNFKGGCGKTTTAYHVGRLMAGHRHKTLLVDLDPQANLTGRFTTTRWQHTIDSVLGGATAARCSLDQAIRYTEMVDGYLDFVPSSDELANVALGLLHDVIVGRMALRRALRSVDAMYDLAIVDCPPEAGILLANALFAADGIILAAEPEEDALVGARRVVEMAAAVREDRERETPAVIGIVATRIDLRTTRHAAGVAYLQQHMATFGPTLSSIPERNGQLRDQELTLAYQPVAEAVEQWLKGGDHA